MEKKLIRVGVPIARHLFLKEGLTANQSKLFVGFQYHASNLPNIEKGENANLSTLPEYKNDEVPPVWKTIKIDNWNEFLKSIGFETNHPERLKEDLLNKLTRVVMPRYPIMVDGKRCTVESGGSSIIRFKRITEDESGKTREFIIMVGGYEAVMEKWWQNISPKFLFYPDDFLASTWRFIIYLGGKIRYVLKDINRDLNKYGDLEFYSLTLDLQELEGRIGMGIGKQNNKYKGKAWKELLTVMGIMGVDLIDGISFPKHKAESYGLMDIFERIWEKQNCLAGIDKYTSVADRSITLRGMPLEKQNMLLDYQSARRDLEDTLKKRSKPGNPHIGFSLTRKMLYEWLPLPRLKEKDKT